MKRRSLFKAIATAAVINLLDVFSVTEEPVSNSSLTLDEIFQGIDEPLIKRMEVLSNPYFGRIRESVHFFQV